MKAVICGVRGNIDIYSPGISEWRLCPCGGSAAKWDDPEAGKIAVAVAEPELRSRARGLGLVNGMLQNVLSTEPQWPDLRDWHDEATALVGYVFHQDKAACWAVPFTIGRTSDSRWADFGEYDEVFE